MPTSTGLRARRESTAAPQSTIPVRDQRRHAALEHIVDHLLANGLGDTTLRTLAEAAGTSDRMLLYYFDDKHELMLEAFALVVERQSALLTKIMPPGRQPFEILLAQMWEILKAPAYEPYMRIWHDALGRVSQGQDSFRDLAAEVVDVWFEWFETRSAAAAPHRREEIAATIAAAAGMVTLRYLGRAEDSERAVRALCRLATEKRSEDQ